MGRKPTRWTNLPRGMRARPRGQKIFYYLDTGAKPRKEIPLGSDYVQAVAKWAELTSQTVPIVGTFVEVWKAYEKLILPRKAPRTQDDNQDEASYLLKFFGDPPAPLDSIEPVHVQQYMRWRTDLARATAVAKNDERKKAGKEPLKISPTIGQVRANREKALLSHIWNFARAEGYTKQPNPCAGIHKYKETGRDVYVGDAMMQRVMEHACKPLQFALRLAHITGQRPGDVLRMSEADISGGMLHVRQGKTKAKLRIAITGELEALLKDIHIFKQEMPIHPLALLVNENGQPMTAEMLRGRFDAARDKAKIDKSLFQFRDLRAKAATEADDEGGTRTAQALLGHTTEGMTADYIRHKVGKKVAPLR